MGENEYGSKYILNKLDADEATAVISVAGGTFINFNPADVKGDPTDPTSYLATDYKVTVDDNKYTVVSAINYTSIEDLLNNNSDKLGITLSAAQSTKYFLVKGTFVEYQNTKNGTDSSKMWGNLYIQDKSGNKILVRGIQTLAGKRFDSTGIEGLTDIAVGDEIVVYGTAQLYNGEAQVNGHIILAVWRNTKYLTSDALLEYVAPSETAIENLTLHGLASWSTSNSDVIAISGTTGTVTRGATDVTVTLTATVADPFTGVEQSKSYNVVVKALIAGEQKVTMKYSGTTTANMKKDENNATTVGLNADIFTVESQTSGTTQNGLNKDGTIRLYGNTTTAGDGNSLIIKIADGYQINSITIKFGNTIADFTLNGGKKITPTSNGESTYVINGNTVTIKNVHSTNAQLWIASINIAYQSVA